MDTTTSEAGSECLALETYPGWSLRAFETDIAPVLNNVARRSMHVRWIETCWPGASTANRYRLFPGSLFLLWLEAFGSEISPAHARIAAAIELLHNASLLHDDILDRHDSRRGERTIRATHGDSFALLTGDAAVGIAFSLLSEIQPQLCADAATALGAAWLRMTEGQMMDEPDTWARIGEAEWLSHWACMSRSKLALGNVAGPLAAQVCGMSRVVGQVRDLHDDFSIVSQIINDLGDLERLSGFHVVTTCRRVEASETSIKPTLARIWGRLSSVDGARDAGSRHANWRAASKWVMAETETALARLDVMALDASAARILKDFFSRPACEVQRIMRGLVDA